MNYGSLTFWDAVAHLKTFTINGSKGHYEVLLRKMEINRILEQGSAQIAPLAIDGRCNVFQHLSALTRDEELARLVGTTPTPTAQPDIYTWFKDLLLMELESSNDRSLTILHRELLEKGIDLRSMVKLPVTTYPYGSTLYNVRKTLASFLHESKIEVSWEVISLLAKCVDKLRKEHFVRVALLSDLFRDIIEGCEKVG